MTAAAPRYRPLDFAVTRARLRAGNAGVTYLQSDQELAAYDARMTDSFLRWARATPERTLFAQRARGADGSLGEWRRISFEQALADARRIAAGLLARGLSAERPVAILSGNSIEHALLALGCMLAGVPWCPVSPAYSTISRDYDKLRHILATLTPGLVFADQAGPYAAAIDATVGPATEVVLAAGALPGRATTPFAALSRHHEDAAAVDAACAATGPDTIVKFLFTSGSTKQPKAVINTHRMWCANQQQMRQSMGVVGASHGDPDAEPPVLVDWLPWNHTFGGNKNFGMVIANGGTMYIDDGKPTPALIGETLRNLREIAPTIYFNVPTGFEAIAAAMRDDAVLRRSLLSRVRMFFYAGAALAQPVWDALFEIAEREVSERIPMLTGLGMTESSPFAIYPTSLDIRSGDLGLPAPGVILKLVTGDDKTEVRYKGPSITPGYWRAPVETAEHYDDEGFFCSGDAVQWIDPAQPDRGLRFDGRIAEDFKLATGTFVSVGPLRGRIIAAGAPYVQDAVITGLNQHKVGALLFPTNAVRELAGLPADAPMSAVLASSPVRARFQKLVDELAASATGSASRVARALLLAEPPSIDKGEATDKGSINQRAVLRHRDALVQALHAGTAEDILYPRGPA